MQRRARGYVSLSFLSVHIWIWFHIGEMQSVLPFPKKSKCAATPPRGEEGPGQIRAVIAAALGLPWPPSPAKKDVGRPTRQEAWVERVQRALRADERESVRALSSLEVPPWWRPGMCLEPPSEADVAAITVTTRELEQDVDREQGGPPKPKRVKVQTPPEAVQ